MASLLLNMKLLLSTKEQVFSLLLIFSLALTLLSHGSMIPGIFLGFNLFVLFWFYSFCIYHPIHSLPLAIQYPWFYKLSKFGLTLLFLIFLFLYYGLHFTQDIATTLFVSMLSLKLLEIRNTQDRRHISLIIFLQYFSLAVSFLSSQDIFLVLYNLLLITYLIYIQIIFSTHYPEQEQYKAPVYKLVIFKEGFRKITRIILFAIPLSLFLFVFFLGFQVLYGPYLL